METDTAGPANRWLMINKTSGSHREELVADLATILSDGAPQPIKVVDCGEDGLPTRRDLENGQVGTFAVFGGDGSLNYAVKTLEGWGGAILPLPGGTANLLCHRLFAECDARAIMRNYVAGAFERRRFDSVRNDQVLALSEILAGPGAKWADVREELRDRDLIDAATLAAEAISEGWSGPRILLRDPVLGKDDGYAGVRLSPQQNGIMVQGYTTDSVMDYLEQGIAILKHDFREGPHDDLGAVAEITCRSEHDVEIPLMVDGERYDGKPQERFVLAPLALDLLCPPA